MKHEVVWTHTVASHQGNLFEFLEDSDNSQLGRCKHCALIASAWLWTQEQKQVYKLRADHWTCRFDDTICPSEYDMKWAIVNKLICQHVIGTWSVKAVGMWSVHGRYVVSKGGQYVAGMWSVRGRYMVGTWSVCGRYVVGKAGRYVVGNEGEVVGKCFRVVGSDLISVHVYFKP